MASGQEEYPMTPHGTRRGIQHLPKPTRYARPGANPNVSQGLRAMSACACSTSACPWGRGGGGVSGELGTGSGRGCARGKAGLYQKPVALPRVC